MAALDDRAAAGVRCGSTGSSSLDDVRRRGGTPPAAPRRVASGRWERGRASGVPAGRRSRRPGQSRVLAPILERRRPRRSRRTTRRRPSTASPASAGARPSSRIPRGREHRRDGHRRPHQHGPRSMRSRRASTASRPPTSTGRSSTSRRTVGDVRLLRAIEWARRDRASRLVDPDLARSPATRVAGGPGSDACDGSSSPTCDRDEITDSDFELLVLALLRRARPARRRSCTTRCFDGDRFVAEVDLAYPQPEDRHRARRRRPPRGGGPGAGPPAAERPGPARLDRPALHAGSASRRARSSSSPRSAPRSGPRSRAAA